MVSLIITPEDPLAITFYSLLPQPYALPAKRLSFSNEKAFTRKHNNDYIELQAKTPAWSLWVPHVSETIS